MLVAGAACFYSSYLQQPCSIARYNRAVTAAYNRAVTSAYNRAVTTAAYNDAVTAANLQIVDLVVVQLYVRHQHCKRRVAAGEQVKHRPFYQPVLAAVRDGRLRSRIAMVGVATALKVSAAFAFSFSFSFGF